MKKRIKGLAILPNGEKMSYNKYIKSSHWKQVKQSYLTSGFPKTCPCGAKENLQLHHETYDNLGHETPMDLIFLCQPCHQSVHSYKRKHNCSLKEATEFGILEGIEAKKQLLREKTINDLLKSDYPYEPRKHLRGLRGSKYGAVNKGRVLSQEEIKKIYRPKPPT